MKFFALYIYLCCRFGSIFEEDHIKCLSISAKEMNLSPKVKTLLSTLELESVCSSQSANSEDIVNDEEEVININNKRTSSDDSEGNKRMKGENRDQDSDVPYFYFNLHKNFKLSGVNLPKYVFVLPILERIIYLYVEIFGWHIILNFYQKQMTVIFEDLYLSSQRKR